MSKFNKDNITILIVEDDYLNMLDIEMQLNDLGYENISKVETYEAAKEAMKKSDFDLAIIDILLGGKSSGINLGAELNSQKIPFLYLSGLIDEDTYNKAKKTIPFAYLEKPINQRTLKINIELAILNAAKTNINFKEKIGVKELTTDDFFYLQLNGEQHKIYFDKIIHIKASGNYSIFQTESRRFIQRKSLKKVLETLPELNFIRISKTTVVRIAMIEKLSIMDNLLIINNTEFAIGRRYKKALLEKLGIK